MALTCVQITQWLRHSNKALSLALAQNTASKQTFQGGLHFGNFVAPFVLSGHSDFSNSATSFPSLSTAELPLGMTSPIPTFAT